MVDYRRGVDGGCQPHKDQHGECDDAHHHVHFSDGIRVAILGSVWQAGCSSGSVEFLKTCS